MATGIALTATAMSRTAFATPLGCERISARSSSEGVSSLVRAIAVSTVSRMQMVPIQNTVYIQYGTPLPAVSSSADTFCSRNNDTFASTAPAPVNMLWVRNPRASWDLGKRSEMNARYGSMEVLLPASSNQKQMTPSQSAPTNGNAKRMRAQRMAPPVMKGRRRPQRGLQVRSLIAPIIGWMTSPVTGPARLRIGSCSGEAPMSRKSGFTADCVRPKLNCTPKNPRFIIRRAFRLISGLRSTWPEPAETNSDVVVVMTTPLGGPAAMGDQCLDRRPAARDPATTPHPDLPGRAEQRVIRCAAGDGTAATKRMALPATTASAGQKAAARVNVRLSANIGETRGGGRR